MILKLSLPFQTLNTEASLEMKFEQKGSHFWLVRYCLKIIKYLRYYQINFIN